MSHAESQTILFEDTKRRIIEERTKNKLIPFTMLKGTIMKETSVFDITLGLSKAAHRLLIEIDISRGHWSSWIATLKPCANAIDISVRSRAFTELKNKKYVKRVLGKHHQYMISPAILIPYSAEKVKELYDKWNSLEPILPKLEYPENMV